MEEEIWKDIIRFEEYFQISNFGRVWSKRTKKILKQGKSKSGYKVISSKIGGRDGYYICKRVHRWVAEAFIDNPRGKPYVNHKDGVKTNNRQDNLEWCTGKENSEHAVQLGLINKPKGVESPLSKLNDEQVEFIRENYKPKCKVNGCRALAKKFNVSHYVVSLVVNNLRY